MLNRRELGAGRLTDRQPRCQSTSTVLGLPVERADDAERAPIDDVGVDFGDEIELRAKVLAYARGQKGGAVVFALATTHGDLVTLEIDVFDAHREAFEQPQAAAVKKLGDEAVSWLEMLEDKEDLAARQDRGQVLWAARALEARELGHRQVEDATVEKDDGAQRLVLGRGGDSALRGKMVQEGGDIRSGEVPGVTAVKADKLANPLEIRAPNKSGPSQPRRRKLAKARG